MYCKISPLSRGSCYCSRFLFNNNMGKNVINYKILVTHILTGMLCMAYACNRFPSDMWGNCSNFFFFFCFFSRREIAFCTSETNSFCFIYLFTDQPTIFPIRFFLRNSWDMEWGLRSSNFLNLILLTESGMFPLITLYPTLKLLQQECPRDQFKDYSCALFIGMIYFLFLNTVSVFYSQMISPFITFNLI